MSSILLATHWPVVRRLLPSIHGCIADQRPCGFTSNCVNSRICGRERRSGSSHSALTLRRAFNDSNIRIDIAIMIITIPILRHDLCCSLFGRRCHRIAVRCLESRVGGLPGWIFNSPVVLEARCISGLSEFALIPSLCIVESHLFSIQKQPIISVLLRRHFSVFFYSIAVFGIFSIQSPLEMLLGSNPACL
jgi:hypothetical protein